MFATHEINISDKIDDLLQGSKQTGKMGIFLMTLDVNGDFFLSGDTPLDVDNEESATINLSKMNELYAGKLPWSVSFSYGKALQKTCIVTWLGKDENKEAAQTALKNRCAANTAAVNGKYQAGTCASVGTDGNITGASGPY